jgi:hypothetical protein
MGHLIVSFGFGIGKGDKAHDNRCHLYNLTSDDVMSV